MTETLTLEDLKQAFRGHAQYKLVINVSNKKDGKKIEVIDEDIFEAPEYDGGPDVYQDYSCLICNLHISDDGTIGVIEHSMGIITLANHEHIAHLCSFIGKKVIFDD